jgi:hypothetical protein
MDAKPETNKTISGHSADIRSPQALGCMWFGFRRCACRDYDSDCERMRLSQVHACAAYDKTKGDCVIIPKLN